MQEGWTALHYAADRGHVEVLHLLLLVEHCNVIATNKVTVKLCNDLFILSDFCPVKHILSEIGFQLK